MTFVRQGIREDVDLLESDTGLNTESLNPVKIANMGYRNYKYLNDTLYCSSGYKRHLKF